MLNCGKDWDECECDCHDGILESNHIMPCCGTCPSCHKRYSNLSDKHITDCKADKVQYLEGVLKRTLTDEEKESLWN